MNVAHRVELTPFEAFFHERLLMAHSSRAGIDWERQKTVGYDPFATRPANDPYLRTAVVADRGRRRRSQREGEPLKGRLKTFSTVCSSLSSVRSRQRLE